MNPEEQWNLVRGERTTRLETAGMGALRITLLFGSAVVAFALLATPILDMRTRPEARAMVDLDMTKHRIGPARPSLYDPPQRASAHARRRLHHPRERSTQRAVLKNASTYC
jgi:hypothetical protein